MLGAAKERSEGPGRDLSDRGANWTHWLPVPGGASGLQGQAAPVPGRFRRFLEDMANYAEIRRSEVEVIAGPPPLAALISGRERIIPYVDDLGLLEEQEPGFLDRAYRRPALRYALQRLPLVLVPCEFIAAALRPLASPATDVVVCRPPIADVYALSAFVDRAVATRAVTAGGRIEIATFVPARNSAAMAEAADVVAALRKDHGFEARVHLLSSGGRVTCPDELLRRPGVVFHGIASADRIREILIGSHLLLGTAPIDAFGAVPLEAAHAGLPAVMPDHPLYREAFADAALFVRPGAAGMAAVIADRLTRPAVFRDARAAAAANLDRWNALSARDRADLLASLRGAGLNIDRLERSVPFLPSRFRP